jgi:hypothetical protein
MVVKAINSLFIWVKVLHFIFDDDNSDKDSDDNSNSNINNKSFCS